MLDDLALNILYDESNKNGDTFKEKTSADYFSGLTLGLFEDAKEEEINLNSISLMTTVGEDKIGGSTYVKEYFKSMIIKQSGTDVKVDRSIQLNKSSGTHPSTNKNLVYLLNNN